MTGTLRDAPAKLRPFPPRTNNSGSDMILSKQSLTNLKIHSEAVVLMAIADISLFFCSFSVNLINLFICLVFVSWGSSAWARSQVSCSCQQCFHVLLQTV